MSAHTPGPWYVGRMPGWSCTCILGRPESEYKTHGAIGDKPIAQVNAGSTHWEHKYPVEANARLIAAAPEMLNALKAVTDVLDAFGDLPDCMMDPGPWKRRKAEEKITAARAAIAKATGGAA